VVGFCEHGDDPSGFIKGWEFFGYLSDYLAFQDGLCSVNI
jgi:hypothetical protein